MTEWARHTNLHGNKMCQLYFNGIPNINDLPQIVSLQQPSLQTYISLTTNTFSTSSRDDRNYKLSNTNPNNTTTSRSTILQFRKYGRDTCGYNIWNISVAICDTYPITVEQLEMTSVKFSKGWPQLFYLTPLVQWFSL